MRSVTGCARTAFIALVAIFFQIRAGAYTPRVIVVGGGVGGLAAAARIAASPKECNVVLLEKNSMLGGRCGSFDVETSRGTFRHERGPSLLLLKQVYQELFQDCAESTAEYFGLEMKQCIPAYQVVFDDGDSIELGFPSQLDASDDKTKVVRQNPAEALSRNKMNEYEPDGAAKWDEYMRATAAFLDCGLPNFIEERLHLPSFPTFLIESLRDGGKAWPLKPHSDVLDAIFESDKMRALASFQDLYVGLEPYRNNEEIAGGVLRKTAPAVFGLLAAIELHPTNKRAGVFAPVGGFRAVEQALHRLAEEKGVQICYGKTATKVESDGVHVCDTAKPDKSEFMAADLVLINADLPYATESLLCPDVGVTTDTAVHLSPRFDWDDKFDFSSGVIAFHWSVDMVLNELNTHNVFLAARNREEAEQSWSTVRNPDEAPRAIEPFNFYVHRASMTDPSAAPQGCDSIMVLVPCQTLIRQEELAFSPRADAIQKYKEQFDQPMIEEVRDAVLKRFAALDSLKDVRDHIIDEVVVTPAAYADHYNVGAGTPFAMSHGFGQLSLTRPGADFASVSNVLFVGAGSRPGNGVPLVLIGAKLVAEKAINLLSRTGIAER